MTISLHPAQAAMYRSHFIDREARFLNGCCARGFGKSYLGGTAASTAAFELMELDGSIPNKNVYIVAPTLDQAKDIYFPLLAHEFGLSAHCIREPSRDRGRFFLPRNVELRLASFEAIERLRGKGAYYVVNDEVSSWTKGIGLKGAWEGIIQPMIVTRWSEEQAQRFGARSAGRALNLSTPKGFNYFYDMCQYEETDDDWKTYHFDYRASPLLSEKEILKIKERVDPIEFATEYLASFKDSGNNLFYMFDRKIHVRKDLPDFLVTPDYEEDVHVAIDFNVGIMAASMFAVRGTQMHFLDEMMGHPDTEELAKALREKYGKSRKIFAYPDPTGKSRKTSAPIGRTDFSILRDHGIKVLARNGSPPIVDSTQAVNRKLMTAAGKTEMFFHPRCRRTIHSMERTRWVDGNPDSMAIDKKEGVEHHSDGVRYASEFLFPVGRAKIHTSRGDHF